MTVPGVAHTAGTACGRAQQWMVSRVSSRCVTCCAQGRPLFATGPPRPLPQVLFNDTIRYNIKYAKPHATDEEVGIALACL